jgi:hypothetical protein
VTTGAVRDVVCDVCTVHACIEMHDELVPPSGAHGSY